MSEFAIPNESEINDMVKSLAEWISKQPNLPQIQEDEQLLRKFLVNCKYRVQKAKEKIDGYYSGRTAYPAVFGNRDPAAKSIDTISKLCFFFPLPRRTSRGELVFVMKANPNPTEVVPMDFLRYVTMVLDVTFQEEDGKQNFIIIADHRGYSFQHLMKLATILTPFNEVVLHMYPGRFKGAHLVYVPSFISSIVSMIRKVVAAKFQDRIHVHKEMDSFYDEVDRDILPSDLGGNEKSLEGLNYIQQTKLKSYQDWFKTQNGIRSKEELQPVVLKNAPLFGVEGSFRTLSID